MFKKGYVLGDILFFISVMDIFFILYGVFFMDRGDLFPLVLIGACLLALGFFKGSLYKIVFGKKTAPKVTASPAQEYVVCPNCGAGYNTEMVANSIFLTSPFMADMQSWSTRVTCKNCRNEIWVTGSYRKVFGQPRS